MLGRFTGQRDAWVLAEGVERVAELESLVRLRVPLARAMARPAADRFDPLVCVDDRGHYLGVLRIEQLVHRLLAGPGS